MKRLLLLIVLCAGCASPRPMTGAYAFVLDPSVGVYASSLQAALHERFANADFIDVVLPADKHEAVVLIRGVGCRNRFDSDGCGGAIPPTAFEYEVYREGEVARRGRANATSGLDSENNRDVTGGTHNSGSYMTIASRALAADIAKSLRH